MSFGKDCHNSGFGSTKVPIAAYYTFENRISCNNVNSLRDPRGPSSLPRNADLRVGCRKSGRDRGMALSVYSLHLDIYCTIIIGHAKVGVAQKKARGTPLVSQLHGKCWLPKALICGLTSSSPISLILTTMLILIPLKGITTAASYVDYAGIGRSETKLEGHSNHYCVGCARSCLQACWV